MCLLNHGLVQYGEIMVSVRIMKCCRSLGLTRVVSFLSGRAANKKLRPNIEVFVLDLNFSHCKVDHSLHQQLQTLQRLNLHCLCSCCALLCLNGGHLGIHSTLHCGDFL